MTPSTSSGRSFDLRVGAGLEGPGERQAADVLRGDLRQRAVPLAGIVAVIGGPAVLRRLQQHIGRGSLSEQSAEAAKPEQVDG